MPRGHHDLGGTSAATIDRTEHQLNDWEILADAVNQVLGAKGVRRIGELRLAWEQMDSDLYRSLTCYYKRWIASLETIPIEKKILTKEEVDRKVAELRRKWGEP